MWGYVEDGELVSACHAAANLVPVNATPEAVQAFAARAIRQRRRCATIVGPADAVTGLWDELEHHWSRPRDVRWNPAHLEITARPTSSPTRGATHPAGDLGVLYGVRGDVHRGGRRLAGGQGGAAMYRARVAQLIGKGWSFARIENGRVLFKAEVAAVSPYACQIQGVYVDPTRRGEGIATSGMAAVVATALGEIAPVVSLYVSDHNTPARQACGGRVRADRDVLHDHVLTRGTRAGAPLSGPGAAGRNWCAAPRGLG